MTSALTIQELLFSGQIIAARTYNYFTIYTMVFVMYFAVGYPAACWCATWSSISSAATAGGGGGPGRPAAPGSLADGRNGQWTQ